VKSYGFLALGVLVTSSTFAQYEKITIIGEDAVHGVFDPSLEYTLSGDTGWLTYSPVVMPKVHTSIARSTDHGQIWEYVLRINECTDDTIIHESIPIPGIWRHEVSTLVHDPDDENREWKLYWHRYFTKPPYQSEDRLFAYGWIAYKYAPDPAGPWSEETALFGAYPYPLGGYEVEVYLNQIHPDLEDIIAFSEPGSLYKDGTLYLTLNGFTEDGAEGVRVILISSKDHGQTWEYVSTLVDYDDAGHLGYDFFTASSLVQVPGRIYLLVSPWGEEPTNHDGTYIFEFEDLTQGKLKRDAENHLIVHDYLPPSIEGWTNAGESDYDQYNTAGGIVMSQTDTSVTDVFRIFNTYHLLTGVEEGPHSREDFGLRAASSVYRRFTTIRYQLPAAGRVALNIYDAAGRCVQTLADGFQPAGSHSVVWDAEGLSAGVYFCRLQTVEGSQTQKLLLLR